TRARAPGRTGIPADDTKGQAMTGTVTTDSGVLRGASAENGFAVFRGVPFAAPPVGDLRFAPPAPVVPWEGERSALEIGPASIQNVDPLSMTVPGSQRHYSPPSTAKFDEDCLYLNIFSPGVDAKRRPVLVWIHGGGFTT